MQILIVEDDNATLSWLTKKLENHELMVAKTEEDAVACLKYGFDRILLDYKLGSKNTEEIAKLIVEKNMQDRVVVTSNNFNSNNILYQILEKKCIICDKFKLVSELKNILKAA